MRERSVERGRAPVLGVRVSVCLAGVVWSVAHVDAAGRCRESEGVPRLVLLFPQLWGIQGVEKAGYSDNLDDEG